ncbi:hypothetical protein SAMN02787144_10057 [Streptomyces atratus]|uniref:Uncharacterized protein n=1 Tax=Streptomyces atratus TaxID=1893 RepID=A0A1K1YVM2_STRAR|nr:hypothetical protein SAMN02787144_10057 [Streptomyces atratus]
MRREDISRTMCNTETRSARRSTPRRALASQTEVTRRKEDA